MTLSHRVAVLPGDGIGREVVPAAQRVLEHAGRLHGFGFEWDELPWDCDHYLETGEMMPPTAWIASAATTRRGHPSELASQQAIFTRHEIERIARQAFRLAEKREGRLVSATKSNGIIHTMPFWDEVVEEVAAEHPAVEVERVLIDALCARVVTAPESLDVIVHSAIESTLASPEKPHRRSRRSRHHGHRHGGVGERARLARFTRGPSRSRPPPYRSCCLRR